MPKRRISMTDVRRLPLPDTVEREASQWIIRIEAGEATEADRAQFAQWHSAHPMHARVYDELRATWQEIAATAPLVQAVSFGEAMLAAGRPQRHPFRWHTAAAAAVAVLLVLTGLWWTIAFRGGETFQTSVGEHATLTLPDGSIADLNADGLIHVEYSRRGRVVRLDRGEAYFTVTHDAQRPFWVIAAGSWVRAVGTAFNVQIRPAQTGVRVTVSEGTIKLGPLAREHESPDTMSSATAAATLTAGDQADVQSHHVVLRHLGPAGVVRSTGWRSGTLYFENQPLSEVIAELSRQTPLKLIVRNPEVGNLPVGGSFEANTHGAETLVKMLQDGFRLTIHRDGERIYIDPTPQATPSPTGSD
jgi:transmembrane sensor